MQVGEVWKIFSAWQPEKREDKLYCFYIWKIIIYLFGKECVVQKYALLSKMAQSVLCCVHRPQLESSFNVMNGIIDCGIELWSDQTKDYKICIFCYIVYWWQFFLHQYQQHKQLLLTSNHWTQNKMQTDLAWDRHKSV